MNQLLQKVKRSSPKKGRRANAESSKQLDYTAPNVEALSSPFKGLDIKGFTSSDGGSKTSRASIGGGWADNSTKFYKREDSEESNNWKSDILEDENDNNVSSIPDLDDFQEEDFIGQVAKAPNVSINRVATYKELDMDLHRHSAFVTLNDIDLKALTRFMSLESDVKEDDGAWTWDILMADVASKFNLEQSLEGEEVN